MRPKLEIGKLYYLKMRNVFTAPLVAVSTAPMVAVQDGTYENYEYLVKVVSLERLSDGRLQAELQILAGTQYPEDGSEMWRPGKDGWVWVRYVFVNQEFQKDQLVIKRLNPKHLPLYLTWPYGKEFVTQLLKEIP